MKKSKTFKYISFAFFVFLLTMFGGFVEVGAALVVPSDGKITCTYTLPYDAYNEKRFNATVTFKVENGKLEEMWSCDPADDDSPCVYKNLTTGTSGLSDVLYQESLKEDNFYSYSNNKFYCPDISYSILESPAPNYWEMHLGLPSDKHGDKYDAKYKEYDGEFAGGGANSVSGRESHGTIQPSEDSTNKDDNILSCNYISQTVPFELEIDKTTFETKVKISGSYSNHTFKVDSVSDCPEGNKLSYCRYNIDGVLPNDYSKDVVLYNEECLDYVNRTGVHFETYRTFTTPVRAEDYVVDADGNVIDENTGEIVDNVNDNSSVGDVTTDFGDPIDANCEAVLGNTIDLIQEIFDWVKIAAPILVIVFGSLDFAKAVMAHDDAAIKKASGDFMKRLIAAVLVFFLPFIIDLILSLPGTELAIENALCGISKVVIR